MTNIIKKTEEFVNHTIHQMEKFSDDEPTLRFAVGECFGAVHLAKEFVNTEDEADELDAFLAEKCKEFGRFFEHKEF